MHDPFADATPLPDDRRAAIRTAFDAQSLMTTLGARLDRLAVGLARVRAPILPGSRQQNGYGHAGLTFSIADAAAGCAAQSVMPKNAGVLSVELKINLLAPAEGAWLVALGRVIKPGRRLVIVQAEVWAEKQDAPLRQVALVQGTMIPV